MVRFSYYKIIIFVVSIIVCNTFDSVIGAKSKTSSPKKKWHFGLFSKSPEKIALEAKRDRCMEELKKYFGESCIKSNDPKTCANRAMIAIDYDETFSEDSEGFAKKYFEVLMNDLVPNNKQDTDDCCRQRFLNIEKDVDYILGLLEISDIEKTSKISHLMFHEVLYNAVVVGEKKKCLNNLEPFHLAANDTTKDKNIKAILKHAFKNITLIRLENTDQLDYFINYIFKKFKLGGKALKPKKFCKHAEPLSYTKETKLTNKV